MTKLQVKEEMMRGLSDATRAHWEFLEEIQPIVKMRAKVFAYVPPRRRIVRDELTEVEWDLTDQQRELLAAHNELIEIIYKKWAEILRREMEIRQ